jgi:hypothetical protein
MNEKQVPYFNRTLKDLQLPKAKSCSSGYNFSRQSGIQPERKIATMNGLVNSTRNHEFRAEFTNPEGL